MRKTFKQLLIQHLIQFHQVPTTDPARWKSATRTILCNYHDLCHGRTDLSYAPIHAQPLSPPLDGHGIYDYPEMA